MKHLGDITKLSGYVVPAVDVVIGGSPCQGLSVAGKQAGLKDERSGLFIEQIRLVKEMRKADAARGKTNDAIRPRYMVWENVPGAFSSNKGRDFEAVLEETVRVAEPKAPLFLSLRKDGPQADASWETDGALRGEFSTLSFGEHPISLFHNGDGESRLWQILEEEPTRGRYATQASLDALHLLNVNACKVTRMGGPISVAGLIARAKSTRRAATQRGIKPSVTASQSHLGSGCSSGCARFTSEMPQWPVFLTASEAFRTFGSSSTAKEAAFGRAKLSRFLLR